MQKSGNIVNIVPDGGYDTQRGDHINTFQMTIQCQDGNFTGQIGAKSQTYPLGVGSPITVDMTQTQHGVRFKKINPQYTQGQSSQQGPQQATEQPYTKDVPQSVWDAKDKRMARMNALNRAVDLLTANKKPFGEVSLLDMAEILVIFIYKGNAKNVQPDPEVHPDYGQVPEIDPSIPF